MGAARQWLLLGVLAAGWPAAAAAGQSRPMLLGPRTYRSPSGHLALHVAPTSRHGDGPADYVLKRGGTELWSGQRPFTLWEAVLADDGTVAGYAYERGPQRADDPGAFEVLIIGPDGTVRVHTKAPRRPSSQLHGRPHPFGKGLLLDADDDRLIVRVHQEAAGCAGESWWLYQLSSGAWIGERCPADTMAAKGGDTKLLDVDLVEQTPLLALHWLSREPRQWPQPVVSGAVVTLVDRHGAIVGRVDLDQDYRGDDGHRCSHVALGWALNSGEVVRGAGPGRFEVASIRRAARVTCAAVADPNAPSGWRIDVVSERPEAEPWAKSRVERRR